MAEQPRHEPFDTYLTIKAAAGLLGVTPKTLRNWDRLNKLKPARHPINGYRLYRRRELLALLASTEQEAGA